MTDHSKSRLLSLVSALVLSCCCGTLPATAQSAALGQEAFPARNDARVNSQFEEFERADRERIKPYLRSLSWLYDEGWIQARQNELFLYFFAKLKHETTPPFVGEQDLLQWHAARHQKLYTENLINEQPQIADENAAWELIAEDLKVCAPLLNSDAPLAKRRAAFAVVAANIPLIGAVLGDAHATRLTYEGFLLPYLELANPGPNLWPAQGQILLNGYTWMLQDENSDRVGKLSRMMIRYGEADYDARYGQHMADATRFVYGNYLESHGQPLRAIAYWREITAPSLLPGAKALYQRLEKEQETSGLPKP